MGQSAPVTAQAAQLFGSDAADAASKQLYNALPIAMDSALIRRLLLWIMPLYDNTLAWFKTVCVTLSAIWLLYRMYLVLSTPLDDLALLLGFDIPVTPIIDLADVKTDGAIVHWTLPEKQKGKRSEMRYDVQLNGHVIDSVPFGESAVTIIGLPPGTSYVVRVCLVNSLDFSSKSEPIRFRTKSAPSADRFIERQDPDNEASADVVARVQPYRGLKDVSLASPVEAIAMMRQNSSGLALPRKGAGGGSSGGGGGRKSSSHSGNAQTDHNEPKSPEPSAELAENTDTIQHLTERLDSLRKEAEEAERLAKEEEEEELRIRDALIVERDALRADAMEKEKASRNLKRELNQLERQNTSAQNERSKQERLLDQKKQERQKLNDDVVRWEKEAGDFRIEAEQHRREMREYTEKRERDKTELRQKLAGETTGMKTLEDEIKHNTAEIKKLERAAKSSSPVAGAGPAGPPGEMTLVQMMQLDAEDDRHWHGRRTALGQAYAAAHQRLENTRIYHKDTIEVLRRLQEDRRRNQDFERQTVQPMRPITTTPADWTASGIVPATGVRRGDSTRSRRGTSGQITADSPRVSTFTIPSSSSPFTSVPALASANMTSGMSGSGASSSIFNFNHGGMNFAPPPALDTDLGMSDEDREKLTGGAPMSPSAAADLLPADLFAGEGEDRNSTALRAQRDNVGPLPGLGGLPGMSGALSVPIGTLMGLGGGSAGSTNSGHLPSASRVEPSHDIGAFERGPTSPSSIHSRPPSTFASPHASSQNLALGGIGSPENTLDADRRSIRSTRSNRGTIAPTSSRFSSMFGIKPRKHNASLDEATLEGPAFGKAQSTSLPRQEGAPLPGLDLYARKRNSSISGSGSHFFGGALTRGTDGTNDAPEPRLANSAASRRTFFGFGKDRGIGDDWPTAFSKLGLGRSSSPRPGSTHSTELPRPSHDSSRWGVDTWPSTDSSGARNSPLSFGPTTTWNLPSVSGQQSRLFGSRHPSRRPSVQYAASGPPDDIPEDEFSDAWDGDGDKETVLAPIGTRPTTARTKSRESGNEEDSDAGAKIRLNPAAKDFRTFLGSIKLSGNKDKDKDKDRDRSRDAAGTPIPSLTGTPSFEASADGDSPPTTSRKSRDQRSILTTTESSIAESSRNSADLARTPSLSNHSDAPPTPSPLVGSNSTGKESFMQKISRKSSSGKFSLPTFGKRDKTTSSTLSAANLEVGEEDEGNLSTSYSSLAPPRSVPSDSATGSGSETAKDAKGRESKESTRPSGRSWSSMLKVSKAKKEQSSGMKDDDVTEEEDA